LEINHYENNTFNFLINRKPFNILDSGLIIVDYFNKVEKEQLKGIEKQFVR
jgi:hypothetical protein